MTRNPIDDRRLIDITIGLSSRTPTYPGDPAPAITRVADIAMGDPLTVSHLSLNCHVGTHVDAPAHFIADGTNVDQLPMECFYGPAVVVDMRGRNTITAADLRAASIPPRRHVLLATDNSPLLMRDSFVEEYCTLAPEAAEFLCELDPWSVGFDYYSLDPHASGQQLAAHCVLADAGVPVFVCLDLASVAPGPYTFAGLPPRLENTEAAPVRAILIG